VINRGKIEETPEKQQVSMMIDGINQLPAPLFFYHKDIIGSLILDFVFYKYLLIYIYINILL